MKRLAKRPPLRHLASVSTALRIVAAVVLVLVAGTTYYGLSASRKSVIADTERQMARLDMVFAEQTGRAVEVVDLLVLGAAEAVQSPSAHPDDLADVLRRRIKGVRQLAAITVFSVSGQIIVSTDTDTISIPPATLEALLVRYRQ